MGFEQKITQTEECLFENAFTPTEETWGEFAVRMHKRPRVLFFVGAGIFSLLTVPVIFALVANGFRESFAGLIFLVGAVIFFLLPGFHTRKMKKGLIKQERLLNSGKEEPTMRGSRFFQSYFESLSGSRYTYDQISNVMHSKNFIFIVLEDQLTLLVRKNAFLNGDEASFALFLKGKLTPPSKVWKKRRLRQDGASLIVIALFLLALIWFFSNGSATGTVTSSDRGMPIAEQDGYVYFQVFRQFDTHLMRHSPEGRASLLVEIPEMGNIQFIGDMLYLVMPQHGVYAVDPSDGAVWKISDLGGNCVVFTEEWIFVQSQRYDLAEGWQGEISRMHPDGSEVSLLSEDSGVGLQLYEGLLYYFSLIDQAIIRMDLDGSNREVLFADFSHEESDIDLFNLIVRLRNMQVHDGWIYYIDATNWLYRTQIGSQISVPLNAHVVAFAILENTLVTLDFPQTIDSAIVPFPSLEASALSTMRLDGRGRVPFMRYAGAPIVLGDYLYFFQQFSTPSALYRYSFFDHELINLFW